MSYIYTANNDSYNFTKVDGQLLAFPNNGSKWSLMKSNTNKYSWIPANDLTGIKINNYDIKNNEITIDSSLLIIINYKIKNIAYYANSIDKPVLTVSNNKDSLEYKLISYVEDNQLVIPFQSSESVLIKLSSYSSQKSASTSYSETLASSYNEYIELTSCSVITI